MIDSRLDLVESTNEMLASYGVPPLPVDEVTRMIGEGAKRLVERALAASGLDAAEPGALGRFRAIYDQRLLNHTLPYEGVAGILERAAARASLAVLSNKPEEPTRRLLEAFNLARYFARVLGGDSAFPRKPDPAGLQHLMDSTGALPSTTLFVGDSMIDIETARRAGVRMCVAQYGFGYLRGDPLTIEDGWTAADAHEVGAVIEQFLDTP